MIDLIKIIDSVFQDEDSSNIIKFISKLRTLRLMKEFISYISKLEEIGRPELMTYYIILNNYFNNNNNKPLNKKFQSFNDLIENIKKTVQEDSVIKKMPYLKGKPNSYFKGQKTENKEKGVLNKLVEAGLLKDSEYFKAPEEKKKRKRPIVPLLPAIKISNQFIPSANIKKTDFEEFDFGPQETIGVLEWYLGIDTNKPVFDEKSRVMDAKNYIKKKGYDLSKLREEASPLVNQYMYNLFEGFSLDATYRLFHPEQNLKEIAFRRKNELKNAETMLLLASEYEKWIKTTNDSLINTEYVKTPGGEEYFVVKYKRGKNNEKKK